MNKETTNKKVEVLEERTEQEFEELKTEKVDVVVKPAAVPLEIDEKLIGILHDYLSNAYKLTRIGNFNKEVDALCVPLEATETKSIVIVAISRDNEDVKDMLKNLAAAHYHLITLLPELSIFCEG